MANLNAAEINELKLKYKSLISQLKEKKLVWETMQLEYEELNAKFHSANYCWHKLEIQINRDKDIAKELHKNITGVDGLIQKKCLTIQKFKQFKENAQVSSSETCHQEYEHITGEKQRLQEELKLLNEQIVTATEGSQLAKGNSMGFMKKCKKEQAEIDEKINQYQEINKGNVNS